MQKSPCIFCLHLPNKINKIKNEVKGAQLNFTSSKIFYVKIRHFQRVGDFKAKFDDSRLPSPKNHLTPDSNSTFLDISLVGSSPLEIWFKTEVQFFCI